MANREHYKNFAEFERDSELFTMLAAWLITENEREAKVDE